MKNTAKKFAGVMAILLFSTAALAASKISDYDKKIHEDAFYQAIVDTAKTSSGRKLAEYVSKSVQADPSRVAPASVWLRENSIDEDDGRRLQSLYFLSYADTLAAMADGARDTGDPGQYRDLLETAMLNLHIFELMATVDAARCQDPTAREAVQRMVDARYDIIRTAYRTFPRAIFDDIEKTALRHEDKFLARSPNADICTYGKAYVIDLAKARGVERRDIKDPLAEGGKRTILIAPSTYNYVPGFVSDAQWLAARKKVIADVSANWARRYSSAIQ